MIPCSIIDSYYWTRVTQKCHIWSLNLTTFSNSVAKFSPSVKLDDKNIILRFILFNTAKRNYTVKYWILTLYCTQNRWKKSESYCKFHHTSEYRLQPPQSRTFIQSPLQIKHFTCVRPVTSDKTELPSGSAIRAYERYLAFQDPHCQDTSSAKSPPVPPRWAPRERRLHKSTGNNGASGQCIMGYLLLRRDHTSAGFLRAWYLGWIIAAALY